MTFWLVPTSLTPADEDQAIIRRELALPAASGIPDLSKAHERGDLAIWLKQYFADLTPEKLATWSEHYWRLAHEIVPGDFVVIVDAENHALLVGEVVGEYCHESRAEGAFHVLPVEWRKRKIPLDFVPALVVSPDHACVREIDQDAVLGQLKARMPSSHRRRRQAFKWITIIVLISELFYFWPH